MLNSVSQHVNQDVGELDEHSVTESFFINRRIDWICEPHVWHYNFFSAVWFPHNLRVRILCHGGSDALKKRAAGYI